MKVKAFVTAAGLGKRFGALTHNTNKCLMKVDGKPLIVHILDKLERAGIRDTVVVGGYQNHAVERCLGRRAKALLNPFYRVSGILGSFWEARPELAGRAFLFTTSDHFFHPSVLRDCLKPGADIRIVVQRKKRYTAEDAKVIIRGDKVVDLDKGLDPGRAHGEFGGMTYFSPRASKLFYRELRAHFEKGDLGGYMMDILNTLRDKHGLSIRYSSCSEDMRIEVDSVHDLVQARRLAKLFNRRRAR